MNGQETEGGAADYREWQGTFPIFAAGVERVQRLPSDLNPTATDSDTVKESDR